MYALHYGYSFHFDALLCSKRKAEPTKAHKLWKEGKTSKREIKSQNKLEPSKKIDKSSEILLFHERKYCEDARNVNLIIKTKHTEAIKNMISRLSQITENPF